MEGLVGLLVSVRLEVAQSVGEILSEQLFSALVKLLLVDPRFIHEQLVNLDDLGTEPIEVVRANRLRHMLARDGRAWHGHLIRCHNSLGNKTRVPCNFWRLLRIITI